MSTWDDELAPGDLISTYYSGIFKLTQIELRSENGQERSPLFYFVQVFAADGKPKNGKKVQCCDASYCRNYKERLQKSISELEATLERLKKVQDELP